MTDTVEQIELFGKEIGMHVLHAYELFECKRMGGEQGNKDGTDIFVHGWHDPILKFQLM